MTPCTRSSLGSLSTREAPAETPTRYRGLACTQRGPGRGGALDAAKVLVLGLVIVRPAPGSAAPGCSPAAPQRCTHRPLQPPQFFGAP